MHCKNLDETGETDIKEAFCPCYSLAAEVSVLTLIVQSEMCSAAVCLKEEHLMHLTGTCITRQLCLRAEAFCHVQLAYLLRL